MISAVIPASATCYNDLEQQQGWVSDASASISPNPPAVFKIVQATPPPIQPPMTMTLLTTGTEGKYSGWMSRKTVPVPAGAAHCLMRAGYTFDSVAGIQAWEVGRRFTNQNKCSDNGQTQLVPINGGKQLEFDIVPSAKGGWIDTGIRFPMFQPGVTYEQELYYVNDANGALSLIYVALNGDIQPVPAKLQHIAGVNLGWAANEAVVAWQPDANPTATPFAVKVTMNAAFW